MGKRTYRKHRHQKRNDSGQLITKSGKIDRRGVKLSAEERAIRGAFLTYRKHAKKVGGEGPMTRYEFEMAAEREGMDFSSTGEAVEFGYQQAANMVGQLTPKQAAGAAAIIEETARAELDKALMQAAEEGTELTDHRGIYQMMLESGELALKLDGDTVDEKIEALKKALNDPAIMADAKKNGILAAYYQALKESGMTNDEASKKLSELFGS